MSSSRRRLLRLVLTGLVVLLLAGYGAFTTFFFNPFEGDYEFDVATLVPRDVDFFTSKAGLEGDFEPFPVPAFADELQASRLGEVLARTPWYVDLMAELDVEATVASLQEALAQAPVAVEPLELFGGEDLALAGYFEGAELADARWAVLGRTGWIGKFGVELLDRPGWIGLAEQGITAEPVRATIQAGDRQVGVTLSGGALTRPLTIGRVADVVVVATDPALVADAARLGAVRGEDSFGLSAKFADRIDVAARTGEELEVFVDATKLSAAMDWDGNWPDRGADTFFPAFLARLFQVRFVNELAGRIGFEGGLVADLEGQLSSELLSSTQARLYRQRHFDRTQARRVARLAPEDVGLFAYLHGDVSDLLGEVLASLDQATVELLEDLVRDVWGYQDTGPLIQDLDDALQGYAAFFVRPDDYEPSALDPPNDGATVLAWALALVPQDRGKLDEILKRVSAKPQAFGLVPLEDQPGSAGIYTIPAKDTGSTLTEYVNPVIPGTGEVATLSIELGSDEYFVVSNSRALLAQVDATFHDIGGAAGRSLTARPDFESFVNAGLPSASALAWFNPRAVGDTLRAIAEETVRVDARSRIDWDRIRPGVERDVLRELFGGVSEDALDEAQRDRFVVEVERRLDEVEAREIGDALPALRQERLDQIALWEGVRAALFELALEEKELAFHARVSVPLEPVGAELAP